MPMTLPRWRAPIVLGACLVGIGTAAGAGLLDQGLRGTIDTAPTASTGPAVIALPTKQTARAQPVMRVPPVGPDNPAAGPVEGQRTASTVDPYAQLGIRAGTFIVYPAVESELGYTTNAAGSAGGRPSSTLIVRPEVIIRSDWTRDSTSLTLRGSYETFSHGAGDPKFGMTADGTSHIDISRDLGADFTAGYVLDHQSVSDPNFPAGADKPPAVHTLTTSAALLRGVGPAQFTVKGDVARSIYDNATSGGAIIDQGDRTNTVTEARLRAGYQVAPAVTPFVEVGIGRRAFDRTVNAAGYAPSGGIYLARSGITFDDGPVLTGEGAIGWRSETRDDDRLPALSALTFDGSLIWSPTKLLTINLNAVTDFNPQPDPASAGSVDYKLSLDAAYATRANVTLHALGNVAAERYDNGGTDLKFSVGASSEWRLNRMLVLTSHFTHEWTDDADPARNYSAQTVTVGARVQR